MSTLVFYYLLAGEVLTLIVLAALPERYQDEIRRRGAWPAYAAFTLTVLLWPLMVMLALRGSTRVPR